MTAGEPMHGVTDRIVTAGRSAQFVGRVGALAAALGIGAVLGPLAIASADPDASAADEASARTVTN